jgi:hypothetical protein
LGHSGITETATGYTFDVKIINDSLLKGYVPEVRKIIGFDVLASDNDNDPYYRDQLSLFAPSANIWCDAALWGTLAFTYNGSFTVINDATNLEKYRTWKQHCMMIRYFLPGIPHQIISLLISI